MSDDTCADCGQPTRWVITEQGRRVELDPEPVDGGNVVPVTVDGHVRARILDGGQLPAEEPAWRRHAGTCPESVDARRRRARLAPRCAVCLNPMDPDLARLEQWTTHPACDTAAAADTVRAALTRREAS
jgi:hypothetical protein